MFALSMRRNHLAGWALAAAVALASLSGAALADSGRRRTVLVEPRNGAQVAQVAADYGCRITRQLADLPVYELWSESGDLAALLERMATDVRLLAAEAVQPVTSTEPGHAEQLFAFDRSPYWTSATNATALAQVNMGLTSLVTKGKGVRIAVLDTGVDFLHPDLRGRIGASYNALDPSGSAADVADGETNVAFGHGTMVAGVLAQLAPKATIMPVRVLNGDGLGTIAHAIAGLRWAVANGADVVLMCFGADGASQLFVDAVGQAYAAGVVLVASAGNSATAALHLPAGLPGVMSVAAVNPDDTRAAFSNFGTFVDQAAPGVGIRSSYPGGGYASWSGTSMAAPFVAGQAALLTSLVGSTRYPTNAVVPWLISSTSRVGAPAFPGELGHGIIDIQKSVLLSLYVW